MRPSQQPCKLYIQLTGSYINFCRSGIHSKQDAASPLTHATPSNQGSLACKICIIRVRPQPWPSCAVCGHMACSPHRSWCCCALRAVAASWAAAVAVRTCVQTHAWPPHAYSYTHCEGTRLDWGTLSQAHQHSGRPCTSWSPGGDASTNNRISAIQVHP
jgi:hypothetical protein